MMNLYRDITKEIIANLDNEEMDDKLLMKQLEKRQQIIDGLAEECLKSFRELYISEEVILLDKEIKRKLAQEIIKVKREFNEFKVNKTVNTTYANMNNKKLNIFSKKV